MSASVSPSPRPSSGSLLTIDSSRTTGFGSQTSATCTVATIGCSLWFGGQSVFGDSENVSAGGVVSTILTVCVAVPTLLLSSRALQVTTVVPSGNIDGALLPMTRLASQTSAAVATP